MAITTKRTRFSRRLPDHVTDELCSVLSEKKVFGFNDLFERVFANLKLRNAVSGGEEMLRLRAYEKLQNLVTRGWLKRSARNTRALPACMKRRALMPPPRKLPRRTELDRLVEVFKNPRLATARVFFLPKRGAW